MKELYKYRYWILFTIVLSIGFLSGIAVGLSSINN